ncbi:MAG TPA: adenosylcobinamide-GDP ribazoletransferase [Thermoleophilia bacterium]|nr:adenosylcobinamide-GDP ribazoletransferase [Thermoleophilia bacterium]
MTDPSDTRVGETTGRPEAPLPAGGGGTGSAGRRATLAITFLTGIPLKVEGEVSPGELWGSMGWYPLVGLVMGAAAWAAYAGLLSFLPALVAATLVVILLELLTRGLHLDGVMDTADGLLSGAPRERALEIMKDHNVGAMGVAAAVLLLVLKVAALGALARADAGAPLLAGWCAARTLPALNVYWWPYARPAGTGEAFTREHTPGPLQLAGGFLLAGVVVAGLAGLWAGAAGSWYAGLVVAVVAMAVALGVQAAVAKRLGGLTGDVYGMGIELAEAAALVTGCAVVGLAT